MNESIACRSTARFIASESRRLSAPADFGLFSYALNTEKAMPGADNAYGPTAVPCDVVVNEVGSVPDAGLLEFYVE